MVQAVRERERPNLVERVRHLSHMSGQWFDFQRLRLDYAISERFRHREFAIEAADFSSLTTPLSPEGPRNAKGLFYEGKEVIPAVICDEIGITPDEVVEGNKRTARVTQRFEGSVHTGTAVYKVEIVEGELQTAVVIKLSERGSQSRAIPAILEELVIMDDRKTGPMHTVLIPFKGPQENGPAMKQGEAYIAMPYLDSSHYADQRGQYIRGEVTPRQARRQVNELFALMALSARHHRRYSEQAEGKVVSMQKSEAEHYIANSRILKDVVTEVFQERGVVVEGDIGDLSLVSMVNGVIREHHTLNFLVQRAASALRDANFDNALTNPADNEDWKGADNRVHIGKRSRRVAIKLDMGYGANHHQSTRVSMEVATAGKGIIPDVVRVGMLEQDIIDGVVYANMHVSIDPGAQEHQRHAMASLIALKRRIDPKYDARAFEAEVHENLWINYLNTIETLAKKYQNSTSQTERRDIANKIFYFWGLASEEFNASSQRTMMLMPDSVPTSGPVGPAPEFVQRAFSPQEVTINVE